MHDQQSKLAEAVRKTLSLGKVVVVVGWDRKAHSTFTSKLPNKKVRFFNNSGKLPGGLGDAGLIFIAEHFAGTKKYIEKLKDDRIIKTILSCETIVNCLEANASLLLPPQAPADAPPGDALPAATPAAMTAHTTQLHKGGKEMSDMEKFAKAFLEAAGKTLKPGYVGKIELGELRKEYRIEKSSTILAKEGWIEGEVSKGRSRIGWYKAGPKMLAEDALVEKEPTNPYEWAKWKVEQKPSVTAKRDEVRAQLEAIEIELAEIERAEQALQQLSALQLKK